MTPLDIAKKALESVIEQDATFPARQVARKALSDIAAIEQQGVDERTLFEAMNIGLDYTRSKDAWGLDKYKHSHIQIAWEYFRHGRASAATVAGEAVAWKFRIFADSEWRVTLNERDAKDDIEDGEVIPLGRIIDAKHCSLEETEQRVKAAIANGTVIRMTGNFDTVINGIETGSPWEVVCQPGFTYQFTQPPSSAQAVRDQALEDAAKACSKICEAFFTQKGELCAMVCMNAIRALKSRPAPQGDKP